MRTIKLVLSVILLVLVITAGVQNIEPLRGEHITLQLDLFFWKWQTAPIPLGFVAPICFLAGVLLMGAYDLVNTGRIKKQLKGAEKELGALRAQTGYDAPESMDSYADEPFDEEGEPPVSDESLPK